MPLPKPLPFSVEELMDVFLFFPTTGEIVNRCRRSNHKELELSGGPRCSKTNDIYYWRIYYKKKEYNAHRLMYYVAYDKDPYPLYVDHINQDTLDNRAENLRLVTIEQNNNNKRSYGNYEVMNKGIKTTCLNGEFWYQIEIEDVLYPELYDDLTDAIRTRYSLLHKYYAENK